MLCGRSTVCNFLLLVFMPSFYYNTTHHFFFSFLIYQYTLNDFYINTSSLDMVPSGLNYL